MPELSEAELDGLLAYWEAANYLTVAQIVAVEGTFRAHQVPLSGVRDNPEHLAQLEEWMRGYRPQERFDAEGRLVPELAALAPEGEKRMGATPHANGGRCLVPLQFPDYAAYALEVDRPGAERRHRDDALNPPSPPRRRGNRRRDSAAHPL